MNTQERKELSTFMSLILRHKPKEFQITLSEEGYTSLTSLLRAVHTKRRWQHIELSHIKEVTEKCNKQRFEIKDDYIRARYGHSKPSIQYEAKTPPATLIHGTHETVVSDILQSGLKKMGRQYVHLSETYNFATLSGQRRGNVMYFLVDTKKAMKQGVTFYHAGGEVWLTKFVPPSCITVKV